MSRGGNDYQLIAMDEDHGQPGVCDGQGYDAKVHGIINDRVENLGIVSTLDVDRDVRILFLEIGKHLGKNVQACTLVSSYNDLAAGNVLHLGQGGEDSLAGVQRLFDVLLKGFARRGKRNLAP